MIQGLMFNESGDVSAACSAEAFGKVDTEKLEILAEREFRLNPKGCTADEVADRLVSVGAAVDALSVRPRVSALKKRCVVFATNERRKNKKGNNCTVLVHLNFYK